MGAYICFMAVRLLEMRRILKDTGSIYVHCDDTASHYIKAIMDAIFGSKNFRGEVIWQRAHGRPKGNHHAAKSFGRDVDSIFHYTKSNDYTHNEIFEKLSEDEMLKKFPHIDERGRRYNTETPMFCSPSMKESPSLCYEYKGVRNPHKSGWRVSLERLIRMDENDEIIWRDGKRPIRKTFMENYKGKPIGCLWTDIPNVSGAAHTGYPTQKPIPLYQRIINASSNESDVIFDPFAGCATTLVAAETLKRKWVGIDIWPNSYKVVKDRISQVTGLFEQYEFTSTLPIRTDNTDGESATPHLETICKRKLKGWQRLSHSQMKVELIKAQTSSDEPGHVLCAGCGRDLEKEFMELDHIMPRADGGSNFITNRILLCKPCNGRKSNTLTLSGLFKANRQASWMHDEELAKVVLEKVKRHTQRIEDND